MKTGRFEVLWRQIIEIRRLFMKFYPSFAPIIQFFYLVEAKRKIDKYALSEKKFDMMITAAMLPKFHGFNLSLYASTHFPGMKIIIISEIYKGMDYKHQAVSQYKADEFFEKPFDNKVFKEKVLELLDIDENDLMGKDALTPTQIPAADTKKIATLKKIEEDKEKKILSSEDIFGDIIKKVEDGPPFEIEGS